MFNFRDSDLIKYINNVSNKPPTIYFLLESIVNYGKDEKTKIKDLAREGHSRIFNFEYPITSNIDKNDFEINILNHYMMRRIGQETFTAFQIQLNAKLNEIMPYYNMMIDSIDGLDIIKEVTSKSGTDNSETETSVENESTAHSDKRYSDTPQNHLVNIQNGEYVTEYNYDTNTDNSSTSGTGSNERTYQETVTRTPTNKIQALKEYQKEIKSIYSLIYDDLDELFYGLI